MFRVGKDRTILGYVTVRFVLQILLLREESWCTGMVEIYKMTSQRYACVENQSMIGLKKKMKHALD